MKLTFVYNARAGTLAGLFDSVHKTVSPDTYSCDLCRITHGFFKERAAIQRFRAEFPGEVTVLHAEDYEGEEALPLVLLETAARRQVLLSKAEIASLDSAEALVTKLRRRLELDGQA